MDSYVLRENKFDVSKIRKNESLMCRGNGYVCVRGSLEERYPEEKRGTFINGVFDASNGEVPELAVMPDTTRFDIYVDGERVYLTDENHSGYSRTLDMETGEAKRSFTWISSKGKRLNFVFRSFVSAARSHISVHSVCIEAAGCTAAVRVITGIDCSVTNSGVQHLTAPVKRVYSENIMGLYAKTLDSDIYTAVHGAVKCNGTVSYTADRRGIYADISFPPGCGPAVIEKTVSFAASRDPEYADSGADEECVKNDGLKYLKDALSKDYETMLGESRTVWKNYWEKHGAEIKSKNGFYDSAVKFALYHLNIMSSRCDARVGLGAKGMSGEGYKGHSYWDTEIFILPYFIFTDPKTARRLLEYRYLLLDSAVKKAAHFGFEGAMYPWEGAWITDGETCPEYGDLDLLTGETRKNTMGEIEIHISADIAYAVWQYYSVTGDKDFMDKYGCEMILLTAVFWCSRTEEKNGRLEICGVIGPDEYKENIDNNAYTNYMAYFNLKLVSKIKDNIPKRLAAKYNIKEIAERAEQTAKRLYLPKADKRGIIPQFDGYEQLAEIDVSRYKNKNKVGLIFNDYGLEEIKKMKAGKQADLIMLFYLFKDLFDEKTVRDNFIYYEERTLHDSSLSMCIHSLLAARLGMAGTAEEMYCKACGVDLGEETDNSDDGIHSASIGGIWLALAFGFGGLYADDAGLSVSPVIPPGWEGYSFKLNYRGTAMTVYADQNGCRVKRNSGSGTWIKINGKQTKV